MSSLLKWFSRPPTDDLYLDLLEKCLLNTLYDDPGIHSGTFDPDKRRRGLDWPQTAHTMIGALRLRNLRVLVETVLADRIPGDLIETGVWRGGACILMRAVLKARGCTNRRVWLADSFEGLPVPDPARYPADTGDVGRLHESKELAIPLEVVQDNFRRYDLLDDQVRFLRGWFRDTLPSAPIERLALVRLDGDLYESTHVALESLYRKLSPGGFVIVDDYSVYDACRQAVEDFRAANNITDPIEDIDGSGAYWRRAR